MGRFSLKSRKSSYASSSRDGGSSATNESTSNSSRPSIADSGQRRSGLTSFSSKLKKTRSKTIADIESEQANNSTKPRALTLGDRFYELPAEIQTSILAYLSTHDLLSLRQVSKQSLAILQANAPTVARNALLYSRNDDDDDDTESMHLLIELYPSTFSSTTTDAYLLRSLRRRVLIERQLKVMLTYIQTRVYILKLTRNLECEHFGPYRAGLAKALYQPVLRMQHFLETVRHLVTFSHPKHPSPRAVITTCQQCVVTIKALIASWPDDQIVSIYQIIQLTILHLRAAFRPPSNITIFERKLKGWGYGPPPDEHQSQLVLLGGLHELSKIDEMQGSYGKRISVVKHFSDILSEAVRINSLAFPDLYLTQTDPVMAMAMGGEKLAKTRSAPPFTSQAQAPKQIRRDKEEVRTAIEARADENPAMKSLDVRVDLLSESTLASIPLLNEFLFGTDTLIAKRIVHLKLVDDEKELMSPYGWLIRLMAECYKPETSTDAAETYSTHSSHYSGNDYADD